MVVPRPEVRVPAVPVEYPCFGPFTGFIGASKGSVGAKRFRIFKALLPLIVFFRPNPGVNTAVSSQE